MNEDKLQNEIDEVLDEMAKNTPGSEAYGELTRNLTSLKKLQNETAVAEAEIAQRLEQGKIERFKAETEELATIERAKTANKEAILGFVKTGIATLAAVGMAVFAVYSEESKIIAGKAWNMATKILKV